MTFLVLCSSLTRSFVVPTLSFLFFQPPNSHICQTLQLNQKVLFASKYNLFHWSLCFVNCVSYVMLHIGSITILTSYDWDICIPSLFSDTIVSDILSIDLILNACVQWSKILPSLSNKKLLFKRNHFHYFYTCATFYYI